MSRLIEALRKAEEEKRKDEEAKKHEATDSNVDEHDESALPLSETDVSAPESKAEEDHSIDFELTPTESLSVEPHTPDSADDNTQTQTETPESTEENSGIPAGYDENKLEVESKETALPDRRQKDIEQDFNRRQTDAPLEIFIPEDEEVVEPPKKIKTLWLLIAILLVILLLSGTAYFFLFGNSNANQYATDSNFLQNRGFLGEMSDPTKNKLDENANNRDGTDQIESISKPSLKETSSETEDNGLLSRVQSIAENATEAATRTLEEGAIEAISAVNTLLESTNSDSVSDEPAETMQDVPVFQINRTKPVKGTSTSLAYAQDNARGGEQDAARLEYEELLRKQPTNRNALIGLAQIKAEAGEEASAKEYYSRLLQLNPRDPVAQVGLLESTQSADLAAIEVELKTLMTKHPEYSFIPFKLGNLFASQGRWSEAKTAYSTALDSINGNASGVVNPDYAFNLAIALEKTQQPRLALEKYIEARDHLTNSSSSHPGFDPDVLEARIESLSGGL